jgi:hypothetical protein
MTNRPRRFRSLMLIGIAGTLLLAIVAGAGHATDRAERSDPACACDSKARVTIFDNEIARFDRETGAIDRLNGNTDAASSRVTWVNTVEGITYCEGGCLDITVIDGSTFLVDRDSGRTWILRWRSSNQVWDEIIIAR